MKKGCSTYMYRLLELLSGCEGCCTLTIYGYGYQLEKSKHSGTTNIYGTRVSCDYTAHYCAYFVFVGTMYLNFQRHSIYMYGQCAIILLDLYHGKPYESKAPTGEYTLKTTDCREISIFPSPQRNIKLPEGSKQHALTDRKL